MKKLWIAAFAGLVLIAASFNVNAQTITLQGATGNQCAFSQMTVSPSGAVTVACSSSTPAPTPPTPTTPTPPPPPPPPAPSGCVAGQVLTFAGVFSNNFWVAGSGQVITALLPNAEVTGSSGKLNSATSPSAYSPSAADIEVSISRCPGQIDTDLTNACNRSWRGGINSMIWFKKAYGPIDSKAAANSRSYCWAPEAEGAWYLNIRYTYAPGSCGYGAAVCGYNWQWLKAY